MHIAQIKQKNKTPRTDLTTGKSFPSLNSFINFGYDIPGSDDV